jgi:hypothetical protein
VPDRLRALLERPLDPRAGRAIVAFAAAILLGFAALFALAAGEAPRRAASREHAASAAPRHFAPAPSSAEAPAPEVAQRARRLPRQDPQDEPGSAAARRAVHALHTHRALQHLPYSHDGVAIRIVGARSERAVLAARAPTLAAARRGWRAFLRRYRDDGRAYAPRFGARRSGRGGGA